MQRQDTIRIEGLEIFANHGVLPEENVLGQKFLVSCEMEVDIRPAGLSDRIEDSVNYAEVSQRIKQVMTENTFNLIEACAEHVAKAVLEMDERIRGVWIEISKPWAPVGLPLRTVSVSCERRRHEVFVALGSNLGDSRALIEDAVDKMNATDGIHVEAVSTLIETEPYGVTDQPSFLNGAESPPCSPPTNSWMSFTASKRRPAGSESSIGARELWTWISSSTMIW